MLSALDRLMLYDASNGHHRATAREAYNDFCVHSKLDRTQVRPLLKAFSKVQTWQRQFERQVQQFTGARRYTEDHQTARAVMRDAAHKAPANRRWELVARSLLAGYQNHCFRSVKKLGGRSDNYSLCGKSVGQRLSGAGSTRRLHDTTAVIHAQSSLFRPGGQEPVRLTVHNPAFRPFVRPSTARQSRA